MEYRISDKLNSILSLSKEEAERLSQPEVTAEHLLLGILRDGQNKAVELLSTMGVDLSDLRLRLESALVPSDTNSDKVPIEKITLSVAVTRLLKISMLEARLQKKDEVNAEHLLLAIVHIGMSVMQSILLSVTRYGMSVIWELLRLQINSGLLHLYVLYMAI